MTKRPEKLHELLMYCLEFAKTMLVDSGDFYPFGATMDSEGKLRSVGAYDGNDRPVPQDLYKLLENAMVSEAATGRIAGAALASNVNIPLKFSSECRDGIRVQLEAEGYSRLIYFPYRITTTGLYSKKRVVAVSDPFSVEMPASMFLHSQT